MEPVCGCIAECVPGEGAASGKAGARQHPHCKIGQRRLPLPHTWLYPTLSSSSLTLKSGNTKTLFAPHPPFAFSQNTLDLLPSFPNSNPFSPSCTVLYSAGPSRTLLHDSAQLPNSSHHRTLTNIPHNRAL